MLQTHILCIGAIYIDTILTVPFYPTEDSKLRATSLTHRRGGNCANTLEVLAQLTCSSHSPKNIKLSLCSPLPSATSNATQFIIKSLKNVDVQTPAIWREDINEAASSFIIKSEQSGSRTIVNFNGLEEMGVGEFEGVVGRLGLGDGEEVEEEGMEWWVHFEGRIPSTTLACIQHLRTLKPQKIKISVEVEKPGREGLEELAALADIVFYSKSWAQSEGFNTAKDCLEEQCKHTMPNAMLCCTWGSDGAVAVQKSITPENAHNWASVDAWMMEGKSVVDTIGAGDTFIAGIMYAVAVHDSDWDLQRKLEFANELAGRKVVQEEFQGLGEVMGLR